MGSKPDRHRVLDLRPITLGKVACVGGAGEHAGRIGPGHRSKAVLGVDKICAWGANTSGPMLCRSGVRAPHRDTEIARAQGVAGLDHETNLSQHGVR